MPPTSLTSIPVFKVGISFKCWQFNLGWYYYLGPVHQCEGCFPNCFSLCCPVGLEDDGNSFYPAPSTFSSFFLRQLRRSCWKILLGFCLAGVTKSCIDSLFPTPCRNSSSLWSIGFHCWSQECTVSQTNTSCFSTNFLMLPPFNWEYASTYTHLVRQSIAMRMNLLCLVVTRSDTIISSLH